MTHSVVIYRSRHGGCCICGVMSSSSRFTSSARWEKFFDRVFNVIRHGDICNPCVLVIKRYNAMGDKRIGNKHWHHKVDSKRPGMNKFRKQVKKVNNNNVNTNKKPVVDPILSSKHRYLPRSQRPHRYSIIDLLRSEEAVYNLLAYPIITSDHRPKTHESKEDYLDDIPEYEGGGYAHSTGTSVAPSVSSSRCSTPGFSGSDTDYCKSRPRLLQNDLQSSPRRYQQQLQKIDESPKPTCKMQTRSKTANADCYSTSTLSSSTHSNTHNSLDQLCSAVDLVDSMTPVRHRRAGRRMRSPKCLKDCPSLQRTLVDTSDKTSWQPVETCCGPAFIDDVGVLLRVPGTVQLCELHSNISSPAIAAAAPPTATQQTTCITVTPTTSAAQSPLHASDFNNIPSKCFLSTALSPTSKDNMMEYTFLRQSLKQRELLRSLSSSEQENTTTTSCGFAAQTLDALGALDLTTEASRRLIPQY